MKILIINGYEVFEGVGAGKLNNSLVDMAKEIFEKKNYEVRVTHVDKGYVVEKELENNLWADIIFIQTPIYWFNIPGKFKKYIDKIYTIGNAGTMSNGDGRTRSDLSKKYGSGGLLNDKKYMLSVTANYPKEVFEENNTFFDGLTQDQTLIPLHKTYQYFGIKQLPTFSIFDVFKNSNVDFDIVEFKKHLNTNF